MADNSAGPAEWDIRVGNKNVARVRPGQSLVIGRKPIRPLPEEEGRIRLDIIDDTKSVSKRHALFTADEAGNATVEDLDSTNGTYVVTANDDLWRIVADIPFDLPAETVHLQLGDVPVDAVPVVAYEEPEPVSQPMAAVSSLFSYASSVRQDDAHGGVRMSVDDILDVRQGEPTQMFHAMKQDPSPFSRIHDTAVSSGRARKAGGSTDGGHGTETGKTAEAGQPAETDDAGQREQDGKAQQGGQQAEHHDAAPQDPDSKYRPHPHPKEADPSEAGTAGSGAPEYKPVFEPGSVFDRLSRGEFSRKEETVEAGGFTSDDAKHTGDFEKQFEIARQPKLLRVLALNTTLYGDLYAWLEALGDADIDKALRNNIGYKAWQKQEEQDS